MNLPIFFHILIEYINITMLKRLSRIWNTTKFCVLSENRKVATKKYTGKVAAEAVKSIGTQLRKTLVTEQLATNPDAKECITCKSVSMTYCIAYINNPCLWDTYRSSSSYSCITAFSGAVLIKLCVVWDGQCVGQIFIHQLRELYLREHIRKFYKLSCRVYWRCTYYNTRSKLFEPELLVRLQIHVSE